jgi:hypothetical protein
MNCFQTCFQFQLAPLQPGATARFNLPTGLAVDASGNVLVADYGSHIIRLITPAVGWCRLNQ